jgi:hypothetical protein
VARRIVLGKVGSIYRFRVSQPGVDAATADLDQLLFDADNIPARVLASGVATLTNAPSPSVEATQNIALGVAPSLCIGVAQSLYDNGDPAFLNMWWVRAQNPNVSGGTPYGNPNGIEELRSGWCTPWSFFGDDSSGGTKSCGWRIGWTSSTLTIYNRSSNNIRVRWAALGF